MLAFIEGRLLKADPTKYAQKPYLKAWHYGRYMAFVAASSGHRSCPDRAAITGEGKHHDWALSWADFTAETAPKGNDDDYRGRLMSLAVAYNWLYPCALFRAVAPKGARLTVVRSRGR